MLSSSIHFIPNCPEAGDLVEKNLTDLQTDCLDLIQVYTWSRAWNQDPTVFEVLRTLWKREKASVSVHLSTSRMP